MAKYVYPAIITTEKDGVTVSFPDLEGCVTCGDNIAEAMLMAEDALAMMLADKIVSYQDFEKASDIDSIKLKVNQKVCLIACDTDHYEKKFSKKVVKKSVSIPKWINDEALKRNVNFSEALKNALLAIIDEK